MNLGNVDKIILSDKVVDKIMLGGVQVYPNKYLRVNTEHIYFPCDNPKPINVEVQSNTSWYISIN